MAGPKAAHGLEAMREDAPYSYIVRVIWVCVILSIAYASILQGIVGSWFDETVDMGHGIFVPLAAGYMVWLKRDTLRTIPLRPTSWGLLLVAWSGVQVTFATMVQWAWFGRTAFLMALVGCIITLFGFRMLRELAYPLCTLILMITPPTFVFERTTLPLQLLASRLGELSLEGLGYSVLREGNILELVGERLAVEEACSGIRSLLALSFLAVVYNYFFVPQTKIRVIMLAAVVPIAIMCNAFRIVSTGVVGRYDRELAHGVLHPAFGHISLVMAAVLCLLFHQMIRKAMALRSALASR